MAAGALALSGAVVAPGMAVVLAPLDEQKLTAADAAAYDRFGWQVAVSGDSIVVGAPLDDDIGGSSGPVGTNSGSVYVFGLDGSGDYVQKGKLTADDAAAGDVFGHAVAVAGGVIVVGAPGDEGAGYFSGSVYVFESGGSGGYSQQAKLTASDASEYGFFGGAVAVAGDTIVVGALGGSGAAYVFVPDGSGGYSQQARLTADDAAAQDRFGSSVAVAGDTIVVGADGDDDGGPDSGSAYVFVPDGSGGYVQQAKLTAGDAAAEDRFGGAVAVAEGVIVVGVVGDVDARGAAYVFAPDGSGGYVQQARLTASDSAPSRRFGGAVAVAGDTIVVGDSPPSSPGAAYVFRSDGSVGYVQQAKLTASDGAADDYFGGEVAVAGDTVVVGALGGSDAGTDSGSVYVYRPATSVTPVAPPAPTAATCKADGAFNPPAAQVGVVWTVDPASRTGPGTYTVTAAPARGYYIPSGAQTTWRVTVAAQLSEGCPPPAPTVQVRAVSGGKKLYVNVNPNKGRGYWQFAVQKLTNGTWRTRSKTYKTWGNGETRRLKLPKGTYRVIVLPRYGYAAATSESVSLRSATLTPTHPDRGVAASVEVRPVSGKSKLHVDVDPNMGRGYWQFAVQKLTKGEWRALPKVYKTSRKVETRRLNLRRGTYRVIVLSRYGYNGAMSDTVWLRR